MLHGDGYGLLNAYGDENLVLGGLVGLALVAASPFSCLPRSAVRSPG